MAKGKLRKRLEFRDYEHAMRVVEDLKSKGKTRSKEYRIAIEMATQLFLMKNDGSKFNMHRSKERILCQNQGIYNWLSISDLYKIMNGELDD